MKIQEIRALGTEELQKQLEEARQALFNLRFRLATRQLVNDREIPKTKKTVARMLTVLSERGSA
ncbi:MAG: 50S ribosomal protein L29 [Dehalococcoidia bacterium]|nr:50S ribosomal protein L29 [Dehalococcoidia bacterium]